MEYKKKTRVSSIDGVEDLKWRASAGTVWTAAAGTVAMKCPLYSCQTGLVERLGRGWSVSLAGWLVEQNAGCVGQGVRCSPMFIWSRFKIHQTWLHTHPVLLNVQVHWCVHRMSCYRNVVHGPVLNHFSAISNFTHRFSKHQFSAINLEVFQIDPFLGVLQRIFFISQPPPLATCSTCTVYCFGSRSQHSVNGALYVLRYGTVRTFLLWQAVC
jgi:hypothetical protein